MVMILLDIVEVASRGTHKLSKDPPLPPIKKAVFTD